MGRAAAHGGWAEWQSRLDALGAARPDVPLLAPYLTYLVLLGAKDALPVEWQPVAIALRGLVSLAVVWMFRRSLPPWGRPHVALAAAIGFACAWGWIAGQYLFDDIGLGGRLPLFPGEKSPIDPRVALGADNLFWTTWGLRLAVATTAVPVVEELFWRAFLLRAFVRWGDFQRVPLGQFTLWSFVLTSALSTLQHPDNWMVSILCWMAFNALFYWKRSVLFLVLIHAFTNLCLYVMALRIGDWSF